jgi:hypothetical protein
VFLAASFGFSCIFFVDLDLLCRRIFLPSCISSAVVDLFSLAGLGLRVY